MFLKKWKSGKATSKYSLEENNQHSSFNENKRDPISVSHNEVNSESESKIKKYISPRQYDKVLGKYRRKKGDSKSHSYQNSLSLVRLPL